MRKTEVCSSGVQPPSGNLKTHLLPLRQLRVKGDDLGQHGAGVDLLAHGAAVPGQPELALKVQHVRSSHSPVQAVQGGCFDRIEC